MKNLEADGPTKRVNATNAAAVEEAMAEAGAGTGAGAGAGTTSDDNIELVAVKDEAATQEPSQDVEQGKQGAANDKAAPTQASQCPPWAQTRWTKWRAAALRPSLPCIFLYAALAPSPTPALC